MAGRGRGKPTMSFSMEQLGIAKGETLSTPVLQPSPLYPPMERMPVFKPLTTEMSYLVEVQRDFREYMREAPTFVKPDVLNKDIERFCEDVEETESNKFKRRVDYDWDKMPRELWPKWKLRQQSVAESKTKKDMDVVKKLTELEKKESVQQPAEEDDKEEGNEEENDEEKEAEAVKDDDEADEMDDGTDYVNEYFENGDDYYSEDDNDDDISFEI
ncbi:PREDICTED: DNA-directed RNA polymerase III subunit RPC7-like [Vollenhovia emeryi]|uniref:DNA-directed RNA polymerase III subunit RPC7-like n=1 Tax=Vollenhovia emeryi TaxID=411798 RepID=UPI0005F3FB58|nr:PREDICTED: DNA-directed RNA polymerase III subunit RPC7-like [Vollenhovia emeryi]